jgi:hypothetical protein
MYAKTFVDQITASEMESKRSGHAVNEMKKSKVCHRESGCISGSELQPKPYHYFKKSENGIKKIVNQMSRHDLKLTKTEDEEDKKRARPA